MKKQKTQKVVTLGNGKPYNLAEACRNARSMMAKWAADPKVPDCLRPVMEAWYALSRLAEQSWRNQPEDSSVDEGFDIRWDLESLIAESCNPAIVADVTALFGAKPSRFVESLARCFFQHMIDRDAKDHYDQLEGYIDYTFNAEMMDLLTDPQAQKLNGLGITWWMDKHIPINRDDEKDLGTMVLYTEAALSALDTLLEDCSKQAELLHDYMEHIKACQKAAKEEAPKAMQ